MLGKLLPRMIDDAFKLTLDVVFPPPKISGEQKDEKVEEEQVTYPVDNWPDEKNLWEHIYTLKQL